MNSTFLSTARLLTQVAPLVFVDDTFALKGGTAINFFIRERAFLLSLVENRPDWDRLSIAHIAELPAIRWKLQNLQTLQEKHPVKFADQSAALRRGLEVSV